MAPDMIERMKAIISVVICLLLVKLNTVIVALAFLHKKMVQGWPGVVHVGLSWRVCMCDGGVGGRGAGPVNRAVNRQFARGSSRPGLRMMFNATIMLVKSAVLLLLKVSLLETESTSVYRSEGYATVAAVTSFAVTSDGMCKLRLSVLRNVNCLFVALPGLMGLQS